MVKPHTLPLARRVSTIIALAALAWSVTATALAPEARGAPPRGTAAAPARARAAPPDPPDDAAARHGKATPTGKLNLNTATADLLQILPGIGPAKAERIVAWRKKNGGYRRVADLRRVKGFGYKTLKRLEVYLDVRGETTLAAP